MIFWSHWTTINLEIDAIAVVYVKEWQDDIKFLIR